MKSGIQSLCGSCVFHFLGYVLQLSVGPYTDGSDFTLSRHERERITSTTLSLLKEGKFTKEPSWERSWVGGFMVRRLVTALFEDCAVQWDDQLGCHNIKSSSNCHGCCSGSTVRTGDVTMAPLDEERLPFLCYKDITLKLVGVTRLENLKACCLIHNEKGDK
jgi:hypothetical protein